MIAFVTSLRHPDNADEYGRVERLLSESLRSISNQTSDDYVVIIVGNRAPSFELPDNTYFVVSDFAPPRPVSGPHADRSGFVYDKGTKIGLALLVARDYTPDYVMIFDADDFVNRHLVQYTLDHPASPGWVIEEGWVFSRARSGYRKQPKFNRSCGTSYIIPFSAYRVPSSLATTASQEEIAEAYGDVLPNILGAHKDATQWHQRQGRALRSLPFDGAVYQVDTGENHSGRALPGVIRPFDQRMRTEFSIPSPSSRLAVIWSCLGPRAIAHTTIAVIRRMLGRTSA